MPMVSMNVKSDDYAEPSEYDPSPCIYLSSDQCEALGLTTPPAAGTKVTIKAVAVFTSVTQNAQDADGDKDISVSLRITDMELGSAGGSAGALYKD